MLVTHGYSAARIMTRIIVMALLLRCFGNQCVRTCVLTASVGVTVAVNRPLRSVGAHLTVVSAIPCVLSEPQQQILMVAYLAVATMRNGRMLAVKPTIERIGTSSLCKMCCVYCSLSLRFILL